MKAARRLTTPTYDACSEAASARRTWRVTRAVWCAATWIVVGAPSVTAAQRVALEVRPRVGDTLRVSLEHAMTLTGPRIGADSAVVFSTTYKVLTRDIVERADAKGTTILAIVDSVIVATSNAAGPNPLPGVDQRMQRARLRLVVMPDGSSRVIEGLNQLDASLQGVLGEMPAVLPANPVAVGESWVKELALPAIGSAASTSTSGKLVATFRLDSLTENGNRAWIGVQGRVEPAQPGNTTPGAGQLSGTLSGTMQLDRRRAWVVEWRALVNLESTLGVSTAAAPLVVKVRFQHTMRTAPARR
ncbi:MAG TPA: hypothetical protein VJR92_11995 [Gemmatimonadaceae bacterium]|nr:hypothetical protein [Gemmatimonadaceae bacterium]